LNAALISIVTAWLSDMKMGYCTTGWWLSQKFCCAEISEEGAACKEWRSWGGFEPFQYIAYVLFAVSVEMLLLCRLRALTSDCWLVHVGPLFVFGRKARQVIRSICCWFWYLGDQVHSRRFYHQRVPKHMDTGHQESDPSKLSANLCLIMH